MTLSRLCVLKIKIMRSIFRKMQWRMSIHFLILFFCSYCCTNERVYITAVTDSALEEAFPSVMINITCVKQSNHRFMMTTK
jgi:hypothetical protein